MLYSRTVTRAGEDDQTTYKLLDGGARNPNILASDGIFGIYHVQTHANGELISQRTYRLYFSRSLPHSRIPAAYRSVAYGEEHQPGDTVEPVRVELRSSRISRDAHGNRVEARREDITRVATRSYDDQGRLVTVHVEAKKASFRGQIDGQPDKTIRHTYDDAGRRIRTEARWTDSFDNRHTQTTRYSYDDAGRMIAEDISLQVGERDHSPKRFEYEYDEQGRKSRKKGVGPNGKVFERVEYTYGDDGRSLTETITRPQSDHKEQTHRYIYDEQGLLTEETGTQAGKSAPFLRKTHQYDDQGRLQATRTYGRKGSPGSDAEPRRLIRYSYNQDGRLVEETNYRVKVSRYSYACHEAADGRGPETARQE